jgi:hypothetical protein
VSTLIGENNNGDLADVEFDFVQVTSLLPNRKNTPFGDAAVCVASRDTRGPMLVKKLAGLLLIFAAGFVARSMFALEVIELA